MLTTIRGAHLAGVRRVKFGGAKVRSRDFVTQTNTTIVLEAPIALTTVPTGVAPDFPLGVAVTARTRRHKSKPLTYTYSASSGDGVGFMITIPPACVGAVTLSFSSRTGEFRSPGNLLLTDPITSGQFDNGPSNSPTVITVAPDGPVACFVTNPASPSTISITMIETEVGCQVGSTEGLGPQVECGIFFNVLRNCDNPVEATFRFSNADGGLRNPFTVRSTSSVPNVSDQPFQVGSPTDQTFITVTFLDDPSFMQCYVVDYDTLDDVFFTLSGSPCKIIRAEGVTLLQDQDKCPFSIETEELRRLTGPAGPISVPPARKGRCVPCSQRRDPLPTDRKI